MRPYEKFDNSVDGPEVLDLAEELLKTGWIRHGFPAVDLRGATIPWPLRDQAERSWNFLMHSLDMVNIPLRAYSMGGPLKFLELSRELALSWLASNPIENPASPLAWYDMAVGLRAYRLAYILEAGREAGVLSAEEDAKLWKSLEEHAEWLAQDENIIFHNNHGYYQIAGQMAMARRFRHTSQAMDDAWRQANERLKRMLAQQFTSEGVHREHSPDYHRMVFDTLKTLLDTGLVADPETLDLAARIEEALSWFVYPNRHQVNFGDSNYRDLRRFPRVAEKKWLTPRMRYWVSGGLTGEPPKQSTAYFPESGYWVTRACPRQDCDSDQWSYLALNGAFHSRTHKHADHLSFVWYEKGVPILVDAGRYGYLGKTKEGDPLWKKGYWYSDPWRVYCESTAAHNVVALDGEDYPRKGVKPFGSALGRHGETENGVRYVEAECRSMPGVRQARMLFYLPGAWLVVLDWFHDNRGLPHDALQWFHLAPELEAEAADSQFRINLPDHTLSVCQLLPAPEPSQIIKGQRTPVIQGWFSPGEREIAPNAAFNYGLHDAITGLFATLFTFSPFASANTEWNRCAISGRKGRLRWRDAHGQNELRFERPAAGALQVSFANNNKDQ